jgi:Bifunctional DNA primase/polymerase, N-terminal
MNSNTAVLETTAVDTNLTMAVGDFRRFYPDVEGGESLARKTLRDRGVTGTHADAVIARAKDVVYPEQTFFEKIATPLIDRGWRVVPCKPKDKVVHGRLVTKPLEEQSNDPDQIRKWAELEPNANVGVYAEKRRGALLFLDKDGDIDLRKKYKEETGEEFPKTLLVRSSIISSTMAKGHWYFEQTPRTIALEGNITEKNTGGLFSLRVHNQYVASIGSIHPDTGQPYEIAENYPVIPMPDNLLDWLLKLANKPAASVNTTPNAPASAPVTTLIQHGAIHPWAISKAGELLAKGVEGKLLEDTLVGLAIKYCESPNLDEIREKARDASKRYPAGNPTQGSLVMSTVPPVYTVSANPSFIPYEESEDQIPPFDPSVMNGIYKRFVDVCTEGTTLAPQFVYSIAKTVVGLRMAGKVKLEGIDGEPRYYCALIGETGSGKGVAWRRVLQVLQVKYELGNTAGLKIINSADSGAGIRDTFLEEPKDIPVLMYVDEIESLGNKATATKEPGIIDRMIELADSTVVSRTKSNKKGEKNITSTQARLGSVMCGQDGEVYMKAFAGRGRLGIYDRLYPEYGVPVDDLGSLDDIQPRKAYELLNDLLNLPKGDMTIHPDALSLLNTFWKNQPKDISKKARWRKHLFVDAFMSAYGQSKMQVDVDDAEVAIKICTRQLIIRKVHFTEEVPDKVGHYTKKCKQITEKMRRDIAGGMNPAEVALSESQFEDKSGAYKINEATIFSRAWATHARVHLDKILVKNPSNGHTYERYIPKP